MPANTQISQPLLQVQNLEKRYARASGMEQQTEVLALSDVSFSLTSKTTLAVVGESGSGKSTLALCIACLEKPTSGIIRFESTELTSLNHRALRALRPKIQIVFQDPANSLNPNWTALEILSEPFAIQNLFTKQERLEKARSLLEQVGLPAEKSAQRPYELSGGQRQRLAIARSLALEPKLLILDEALSALDCSVQAQIINLLLDLQSSLGLSYLFITHDFAMAAHISDQIAVMHRGQIIETGSAETIVRTPQHPATERLIASAKAASAPQILPRELQAV